MSNKGSDISKVIAYLSKQMDNGYTHVAVSTPDRRYCSMLFYDEMSRKQDGVLIISASSPGCMDCSKYYNNGEVKEKKNGKQESISGDQSEKAV